LTVRLKDKVSVITGAGMGLGRACALEFAAQGSRVVIGELSAEAGEAVAKAIREAGGSALAVPTDVSRSEDCQRLMEAAVSEFGRIDILLANAGIEGNASVDECSEELWDRVINVNLKGTFLCCKFAVRQMKKQGGGVIVNMSSISAFWGEPGSAPYNASKGGILALTRAMAMDHGRDNIRVNCLSPAYLHTEMLDRYISSVPKGELEQLMTRLKSLSPLNRTGDPAELARAAVFLASDECGWATGSSLVVDGGVSAGYPWL
jgi:NAD(P)-dependent dehydrogenase (short-subunit alcohol dehydrogenase family)